MKKEKIYMASLGCSKNLVDSEVMLGELQQQGYTVSQNPEEAAILLINTCGFIQSAVEEGIDEILDLVRIKEAHPDKKIVVTGCMVQRYGEKLQQELPEVDLFIGTEGFHTISSRIHELTSARTGRKLFRTDPSYLMDATTPRQIATPSHRAFLKITEGCNNRCSYCLIPSIRGKLRSRNPDDLIREVNRLEALGIRELTLIAQDLTAYGRDLGSSETTLQTLLQKILTSSSIPWIRLLYLHPMRVTAELLELIAANPRLLPYLDIPLQHVNSDILQKMNRPYDRNHIDNLITTIRTIIPGAAIRTTLMCGFPGETYDHFREVVDFLQQYRLDHVGVFPFSNEEGCLASTFPSHCPAEVKNKRVDTLMQLQSEISLAHNQARLGKTIDVLVEGLSRETDLLVEGRSRFQAPDDIDGCVYITDGNCAPGDIVKVRITEAHTYDLAGEIL